MEKVLWSAVDEYTEGLLMPPDPVLESALAASKEAGLPSISVSPSQGKLIMLLAKLAGAARILEIGKPGGGSMTDGDGEFTNHSYESWVIAVNTHAITNVYTTVTKSLRS